MIRCLLLGVIAATLLRTHGAEVFPRGASWRYLKGLAEASSPDPAAWRLVNFNDSSWTVGPAALYYGEPLTGTLLGDMQGSYTSVFIRKTFMVGDPAAISELTFESLSDDGFIGWINGKQFVRYNMPEGDLAYNATALPALTEPIPWETTVISNPRDYLVPGTNVIAIHGFNTSLSASSDFVFDASLSSSLDDVRPVVQSTVPAQRAQVLTLRTVEIIFSEAVTNVNALDLLINGVAATNLISFGPAQYVFEFPEPPTGTVQINWAANHGIVDLSPAANAFIATAGWTYDFNPSAPQPAVMISEFMADNDETLNDENGDSSDWIEIFNPTTVSADLTGWFLSNDTNNLARWRFPAVSLAPNSYLVVFASEKNRTNPAAKLHTNFKLAKETGFLALSGPRTNLVSVISGYPEQQEDVSYGRERGNPNLLGYFTKPTPGAPNVPGGPGFAPNVTFSRDGGTFQTLFNLVLSTPSSNAVIRYTLDMTLPTETSPVYTGPIAITNSMQVRTRAFESGLLPGEPRSETFVMLASAVMNVTSDLPIVILYNYGGRGVPASGEQPLIMQIFEPKNGVASMTNKADLSQRARFRLRGSSTQGYAKGSYALETWNEFNDDQKVDILGMPEESDWVFYAPNNFEPVLIHNPFAYGLSREIGRYAPRTRFVEVYLNTAGGAIQSANYNGIYVIEEKIKRGEDRVDVDKLEPEHLNAPEVTGGYMLKIDRSDPGDSPFSAGGQSLNYVDPKGEIIRTAARTAQATYIRNYINQFGTALNGANFRDPISGYRNYIDVASWLDHSILNVLAFNVDALRLSTYLFKPRNGKIEFGPVWDFDRALGSTDGRDSNPRVWSNYPAGTEFFKPTSEYPWWGRLFQDPDFYQGWIDRWEVLRRKEFALTNFNRIIDEFVAQVRKAQPREQARWGIAPRGGSYTAEVNLMKTWLKNRAEFIDGQFVRPPGLATPAGIVTNGTSLTINPPAVGTVYYTLDGSDPRLPGGGISGNALIYSGPITISGNVRVVARSRNPLHAGGPVTPSPWSGVVAASYVVETPALALTEIMYNPSGEGSGALYSGDDFEFLEFRNASPKALNLAGFTISGGVQFTFPAISLSSGEFILVVKNRLAFESRYGTSLRIAGEFTGNLANSGDHVLVEGPLRETIADVQFQDFWFPITDGPGFSMVPYINPPPIPAESFASAWRPSSAFNGSPGRADSAPTGIPAVLVNELLTHTDPPLLDTLELYNPTDAPVSVAGWYLTDEFSSPKKFKIPAGTSIPTRGFITFNESQFNVGANAFTFSSKGEQVYLFSANANGDLSGYVHGFEFDAAANGITFGRHVTTDGREVFPAQSVNTLGAANAAPRAPEVIFSEINYQPPLSSGVDNTLDEFVELYNTSMQPVNLFDPAHLENTWRLRGGIDYEFPQGAVLTNGGFLLLVNFDPANTTFASGFRSRLNVSTNVPLYGPYRGKLSNDGDLIKLQRPDAPEGTNSPDAGLVPYIVVEQVRYSPSAPWFNAAGNSNSLQRIVNSFADDPHSWRAEPPTPGSGITAPVVTDSDGDGLPDLWEIANGLQPGDATGVNGAAGDPDGDGLTNFQEFTAGTSPRDPASAIRINAIVFNGSTRSIRFNAAAGISYTVLYRDSLSAGSWTKLTDIDGGAGGIQSVPDNAVQNRSRFYRLVTPKQ